MGQIVEALFSLALAGVFSKNRTVRHTVLGALCVVAILLAALVVANNRPDRDTPGTRDELTQAKAVWSDNGSSLFPIQEGPSAWKP